MQLIEQLPHRGGVGGKIGKFRSAPPGQAIQGGGHLAQLARVGDVHLNPSQQLSQIGGLDGGRGRGSARRRYFVDGLTVSKAIQPVATSISIGDIGIDEISLGHVDLGRVGVGKFHRLSNRETQRQNKLHSERSCKNVEL
jgi:hypothetical protein